MDTTGSAPSTHFPGHFSSSPSPPLSTLSDFLPSKDAKLHTDSDVHLPGAYPSSPSPSKPPETAARLLGSGTSEETFRGAMQRLPSGPIGMNGSRSVEGGNADRRESGFESVAVKKDIGKLEKVLLDEENKEENNFSDYGTLDSRPESARPPSRIDLHSTSPAPEIPARSPLRSGFMSRDGRTKPNVNINADAKEPSKVEQLGECDYKNGPHARSTGNDMSVSREGHINSKAKADPSRSPKAKRRISTSTSTGSDDEDEDENTSVSPAGSTGKVVPKPQTQPTLNTTPTQAHVKEGSGVSVNVPGGMLRAPGIEDRIVAGRDMQDASAEADEDVNANVIKEGEEDDSFVDASAEFAQGGDDQYSQQEDQFGDVDANADVGKEERKSKSSGGSLLSKMKRTLSKAGR